MLKVKNMLSNNSGRPVPNQFIITDTRNGYYYFQSYDSLIAKWDYDSQKLTLGKHFDYSVTTSKYLHIFIDNYCSYDLVKAIQNAKGNSYSKKLEYLIDNDIIAYDYDMV